jgi:hypothetical protein
MKKYKDKIRELLDPREKQSCIKVYYSDAETKQKIFSPTFQGQREDTKADLTVNCTSKDGADAINSIILRHSQ